MPISTLDQELGQLLEAAERTAAEYLQSGRYTEAARIYSGQLAILKDLQRRMRKRLHKGGPLHNLGIALLLEGQLREGSTSVLLALVEDVLSAEVPFVWREAPAYLVLQMLGFSPDWLSNIENAAIRVREAGRVPKDPNTLLRGIGIEPSTLEVRVSEPPERLPLPQAPAKVGTWVFVGGSFKTVAILRDFRDTIRRRGHFPILLDYKVPQWLDTYDVAIAALDQCEYAVFEVTIPEGQIAEIVHHHESWIRSGNPNPRILLLIQELFGSNIPRTPAMIPPSYKKLCKRYRALAAARRHIRAFLPWIRKGNPGDN